jgi:predicted nucleotidyltransferase
MRFYKIASDLEEQLHKQVDLHTYRQLSNNEKFLEEFLKDGVKIYG